MRGGAGDRGRGRRHGGMTTMEKPKARHAPDVRARATAALLVGGRPAAVARDLGVPEGTVRSWKHRIKNGQSATLKKGEFGGLLMEHLRAMMVSLIEQSRMLQDPKVLREIPAGQAAVLFGTLFDRTMRMLEMLPAVDRLGDRGGAVADGPLRRQKADRRTLQGGRYPRC